MQKEIQKNVQTLLKKDMDRKEFLQHVGVGLAAVVGITSIVKSLSHMSGNEPTSQTGYGSAAYGGAQQPRR